MRWNERATTMSKLLHYLSAILFVAALAAMVTLLASDAWNALTFTPLHRQAGALSFAFIGLSYIALQLSRKRKLKNILLGIGFLFWGSAQLLPLNTWVTAMDTSVVLIFVMDLSVIIFETLRAKNHD